MGKIFFILSGCPGLFMIFKIAFFKAIGHLGRSTCKGTVKYFSNIMPNFEVITAPANGLAVRHNENLQTHIGVYIYNQNVTDLPTLIYLVTWWRHQMEIFSALLALCAGNSPVTGEFPAQRSVTRSFDVFLGLRLNRRLGKQPWGWWFETPSCPLWRHCNDTILPRLPLYVDDNLNSVRKNTNIVLIFHSVFNGAIVEINNNVRFEDS